MSNVIKIENLYKEYRLGIIGYGTLKEDMESWWARLHGKPDPNSIIGHYNESPNLYSDRILALNGINLEVKQGEKLGIIGKNGAGKTTLLKILSQISSPTDGIARIKGRMASLLAVGSGFHRELTGRENIYLNGSILGLRKFEIDQRFDEIVDFSGVRQFIDTPVKRYSSGMYVRLGFAVSAHLDPDILIVDEVLAVGDAEFQKKAIGKMKNDSTTIDNRRTILFVSHNMESIRQLCNRVILLDSGKIVADGSTSEVIDQYLGEKLNVSTYEKVWSDIDIAPGNEITRLASVKVLDSHNQPLMSIRTDQDFSIEIMYYVLKEGRSFTSCIEFIDINETLIFGSNKYQNDLRIENEKHMGKYTDRCLIPANLLTPGKYIVSVTLKAISFREVYAADREALTLNIVLPQEESFISYHGVIKPKLEWYTDYEKDS